MHVDLEFKKKTPRVEFHSRKILFLDSLGRLCLVDKNGKIDHIGEALAKKGDPGLKGDPGEAGAPAPAPFEYVQSSPSAEWIINHNRGAEPMVAVLNSSGFEVEAEVFHFSINQTRIYFSAAQSGKARLS